MSAQNTKTNRVRSKGARAGIIWKLALGLVFALNIGLAYSLWTNSEHGLACYLALQERKQALEGRLAEVQEENRALSRKIRLLEGNQRYLEYTLHVRGRYVRPGEILYLFTPKDLRQEEGVGE